MLSSPIIIIIGVFLLGTYAVSTLDDLIRMRASKSFLYVWILISIVLAVLLYQDNDATLTVRLGIAVLLPIILCSGLPGFKLAYGDVFALLPIVFLLPLVQVFLFFLILLLTDRFILRLFYMKMLRHTRYPFMPAILISTGLILMYYYYAAGQPIILNIGLNST